MPRPIDEEEYCPNCGQYRVGETVCPNCGAVLDKVAQEDDLDGFHETDGEEDINSIDLDDDDNF